jgi:hypothetical protein
MPSAEETMNTAIMAPTSHTSTVRSGPPPGGKRPSSKTRWVSSGGRIPSAAEISTSVMITAS